MKRVFNATSKYRGIMSNNTKAPLLLTVREVTRLLRVQRPKVYELIKDGAIDGFKLGADWRIRRDSVENLIGPIPLKFFQEIESEEGFEQEENLI